MINYDRINKIILAESSRADSLSDINPDNLYEYLLNNKIALYFSKKLNHGNPSWLVKKGENFEKQYINSLSFLDSVCKDNGIEYLLYKTHRYFGEVVDGDIDIIVREKDFKRFMNAFEENGFNCLEDEPGKGKCEKEGFLIIEPHTTVSWRGGAYLEEGIIWEGAEELTYKDLSIKTCSQIVEIYAILAKSFYEPAYVDLYSLKLLFLWKDSYKDVVAYLAKEPYLLKFYNYLLENKNLEKRKFPIFAPTTFFIRSWFSQFFIKKRVSPKTFVLHLTYYFYWRMRYFFRNKLPFTHDWKDA